MSDTDSRNQSSKNDWVEAIASLSPAEAAELAQRASSAPLYAHAYAMHLNFRYGGYKPVDLLEYAARNRLAGVKIHVEDGEANSLQSASASIRQEFGEKARKLGLKVHIETSSTARTDLEEAIDIARAVGATSVRSYPRYEGHVSEIIEQTVTDLKQLAVLDPDQKLLFTLEQHEDLTSIELVQIMRRVNNPRLSLLFDFGNMINSYEQPLEALATQASYITEVHVKDLHIVPDRGGWAQTGCISGSGDLPFTELMLRLLMLGADKPQVSAFALEEERDYYSPALRFPDEAEDPFIPFRTASLTSVDPATLPESMAREQQDALNQITTVRSVLDQIKQAALVLAQADQGVGS